MSDWYPTHSRSSATSAATPGPAARRRPRGHAVRFARRGRVAILAGLVAAGVTVLAWGGAVNHPAWSATSVPLVVYSAQGYDANVTKAFQAATGIQVALVDDSTGPLLVKVQAERNNPKWAVLWVDGDEAFAAMDQQQMLQRGYSPNVRFNSLGLSLTPSNKSYVPTGVTMAGTVVYSTKTVTKPPTTWSELLSPAWRGAVGMNNPAISGPTYPFVAGLFNYFGGVPEGQKFFLALKANGLKVFRRNGDTLHALETGDIKIALIQSSAGIGAGTKASDIKLTFIRPSTPIPSVIGIDGKASAEEIAEAKQFVEFVLSPQGQDAMKGADPTGDSLYWPVVEGISPLPQLPPLASVPSRTINAYQWGALENSINSWFASNIVQ